MLRSGLAQPSEFPNALDVKGTREGDIQLTVLIKLAR